MAGAFIAPELAIEESEAKELTAALAEVNSFYGQTVDPKVIAWMGLIGVAGKVYGPRVGAFMLRRDMEKRAAPKPEPGFRPTVVPKPAPAQSAPAFTSDPSFVSTPDPFAP